MDGSLNPGTSANAFKSPFPSKNNNLRHTDTLFKQKKSAKNIFYFRHQNERLKAPEFGNYVARLYQITENITNPDLAREKPDGNRLLNVVYVSSIGDGWQVRLTINLVQKQRQVHGVRNFQVFKIKTAINNWLNGDDNLGFLITFKDNADKLMNINFAHKNTSDDSYQSFIVLYLRDKNSKFLLFN